MDKDKCIRELYKFLSEIDDKVHVGDLKVFRRGGIGGQDQYAGMSPYERHFAGLVSEFGNEIADAFKGEE